MIDATSALLNAVKREFCSVILTIEKISSQGWVNGTYAGSNHELVVRLDGKDAAAKADAFAARPDFDLRGHLIAEIELFEHEAVTGGVKYARLGMRIITIEDHWEPRAIAEPDPYPAGAIVTYENRRGQPWMLVGHASGIVVITNGVVNPPALRLYRFLNETQAKAGAEVLVDNARLDLDGSWFLPDIRYELDEGERKRGLMIWAAMMDIQFRHRLRGLGYGHYSIAHKALAPA